MRQWFTKLKAWFQPQPPSPAKVVIDTSVLVAAFFKSKSLGIIDSWQAGDITVCYSPDILNEYRLILGKIPPIRQKSQRFFQTLDNSPATQVIEKPPQADVAIEDPDDLKFVSCAVACRADCIVSLDQHLLTLEEVQGVAIMRPNEFIRKYELDT